MTLSELIAALEAVRAEHGDLPVMAYTLGNEERAARVKFLPTRWRQDGVEPSGDAVSITT